MTTPHRSTSVRVLGGATALLIGCGAALAAAAPAAATPADDCSFLFDGLAFASVDGEAQLLADYPCVPQYSFASLELQVRSLGAPLPPISQQSIRVVSPFDEPAVLAYLDDPDDPSPPELPEDGLSAVMLDDRRDDGSDAFAGRWSVSVVFEIASFTSAAPTEADAALVEACGGTEPYDLVATFGFVPVDAELILDGAEGPVVRPLRFAPALTQVLLSYQGAGPLDPGDRVIACRVAPDGVEVIDSSVDGPRAFGIAAFATLSGAPFGLDPAQSPQVAEIEVRLAPDPVVTEPPAPPAHSVEQAAPELAESGSALPWWVALVAAAAITAGGAALGYRRRAVSSSPH